MTDSTPFPAELTRALATLVQTPYLLVGSDFDGTISPLCSIPAKAEADSTAVSALRELSELPDTSVAIVSGRGLDDLRSKLAGLKRARMIGSHGSEFESGTIHSISPEQKQTLSTARDLLSRALMSIPGALLEEKPYSVALHYRNADLTLAERILEGVVQEFAGLGVGRVCRGICVVEFLALDTDKGEAFTQLRHTTGATGCLFVGDDVTDESVFSRADPATVTVKIGEGQTTARFRIGSIQQSVQLFAYVAEKRRQWLFESPLSPIDRHVFLSDLRTFALTDERARIVWLSAPCLDSPPIFGELVGGRGTGSFYLGPPDESLPTVQYRSSSLISEAQWQDLKVTDFLDASGGRAFQRAGRTDLVRVVEGRGDVVIEFAPRADFGRLPTRMSITDIGIRVEGNILPLFLHAPGWSWTISREGNHDTARGKRRLNGETISVELLLGTGSLSKTQKAGVQALADTEKFWSLWLQTLKFPTVVPHLVARSALVLRGLSYGPTGAIAAAATTSLPEDLGGIRNWDYRYCWPRDAALSATALVRLGSPGAGVRLLDWLLGILEDHAEGEFIRPLYSVSGKPIPSEADVAEAVGYRGSRPVRLGNLAAHQLQLDVLGPIAELLASLAESGVALSVEHVTFLDHMVSLVEQRWKDPDHGIWEVREAPRHFVHSKVMCWYAVTESLRAITILGNERPGWQGLADEIRSSIETNGFSSKLNSYIAAYDLEEPDAALFWMILSGFHSADDPRSIGTVAYLENTILRDESVYRYVFDDGLPGKEGSWHICLAWLIEVLAMQGRRERAQELFNVLISRVGPIGLLSEQWEPKGKFALGNYPQAYSHIGLINSAIALAKKQ